MTTATAIGYLRVSRDDQALGPDAQRAAIEAWAARERVTVASWHFDQGISGATPISGRPALLTAIASLRQQQATLLVAAKRDRLARDIAIAAMIERLVAKENATIRTADGMSDMRGSAGLLQRGVSDLFAAHEREVIRERTTAALAVKRAKGEKLGGHAPYGYRAVDGRLYPDEHEQSVIATVQVLRSEGRSLRAIVDSIKRAGTVSRVGKPFALTQIANMLKKKR
jgi:DNA invertase Pin-like site-specific DNA recombinase